MQTASSHEVEIPKSQPARAELTQNVNDSLWRLAEEETLFLLRKYKLSAAEVVEQYTGIKKQNVNMNDAIDAVYRFNISTASHNGFVVT